MVEMMLDAQGAGTGIMTGAARVKPTPEGGLVVDEFEVAPVTLTIRRVRKNNAVTSRRSSSTPS